MSRETEQAPVNETAGNDAALPLQRFKAALERLERAPAFARRNHIGRLLDTAARLLKTPGGAQAAYGLAPRFDVAGVFAGTDWDHPDRLQAAFVPQTLTEGDRWTVTLECLSLLRLLSLAQGGAVRLGVSAEQAGHYLREVLALNLDYLFERRSEATRARAGLYEAARCTLQHVAEAVGYEDLLEQLVDEIWRLLRQRPIEVGPIRAMITQLATYCYGREYEQASTPAGAERLISALYGPSPASREDPGLEVYAERLRSLDTQRLQEEANACARAMHDTGLSSSYHAVLVRHVIEHEPGLVGAALGLSTTGLDGLLTYRELVTAMITKAVYPETCQCLYGLAALLERAVLHDPGVGPSLWRQLKLPIVPAAQQRIAAGCGTARPPDVFLLAGVISILGQPLGVGQGNNPTCQSARALSLWAYSDPDYLLQLLAWAARDDGVLMTFQGRAISSAFLPEGEAGTVGSDLDPVSLVLVPHLDRVYSEMCRLAARVTPEDPHVHVNPEFHGWRVGAGFAIAVDVATGLLKEYEAFVRLFYACFHPSHNGGHPVIHPQPVGLAATDSRARFVGWHAVTVLRVALDAAGEVRVYFFNPNNDKGQDWGHGVKVSTAGHGEVPGESSLPVAQFASRLYLFHYDPLEVWNTAAVPADEAAEVMRLGKESWAASRVAAPPEAAG